MRETFFDNLQIASMERIHTQIISWIFKLPIDILDNENKTNILKKISSENFNTLENIKVFTEINNLDLVIESNTHLFVFENKLKSSEHDEQSIKYEESIEKNKSYTKLKKEYIFLSLIKEKPLKNNWKVISYSELYNYLKEITIKKDCKEFIFLEEYLETLKNLKDSFDKFISNHKDFKEVFKDGNKSKNNKILSDNEYIRYIQKNQLETIFQKAFFNIIKNEITDYRIDIDETRGNSYIQITIDNIEYKNKIFYIGLQYQNNNLKVNLVSENYEESKKSILYENNKPNDFLKRFINTFKNSEYKRENPPDSKAYFSLSKSLKKKVYEMDIKDIKEILKEEIKKINDLIPKFKDSLPL